LVGLSPCLRACCVLAASAGWSELGAPARLSIANPRGEFRHGPVPQPPATCRRITYRTRCKAQSPHVRHDAVHSRKHILLQAAVFQSFAA
jgi:hypothetical protein